jgi:hypothetical protein
VCTSLRKKGGERWYSIEPIQTARRVTSSVYSRRLLQYSIVIADGLRIRREIASTSNVKFNNKAFA